MIWSDDSVLFLFGKDGSGVPANSSLGGAENTFSFSTFSVFLSFSAEACTISQWSCDLVGWLFFLTKEAPASVPIAYFVVLRPSLFSRQMCFKLYCESLCHSLNPCYSGLSNINKTGTFLPFSSQSLAHLEETIFSLLLLFYHAAMGSRSVTSSEELHDR